MGEGIKYSSCALQNQSFVRKLRRILIHEIGPRSRTRPPTTTRRATTTTCSASPASSAESGRRTRRAARAATCLSTSLAPETRRQVFFYVKSQFREITASFKLSFKISSLNFLVKMKFRTKMLQKIQKTFSFIVTKAVG
jgi:hypothetical protein